MKASSGRVRSARGASVQEGLGVDGFPGRELLLPRCRGEEQSHEHARGAAEERAPDEDLKFTLESSVVLHMKQTRFPGASRNASSRARRLTHSRLTACDSDIERGSEYGTGMREM